MKKFVIDCVECEERRYLRKVENRKKNMGGEEKVRMEKQVGEIFP